MPRSDDPVQDADRSSVAVRTVRSVHGPAVRAPHTAPSLSVSLALGAPARLEWRGGGIATPLVLRRGDLIVVPPDLVHQVDIRDPLDVLTVMVSDPFADELAADLGLDIAGFAPRLGVRDRHAEAALRAVLAERGGPGARRIAQAAATTALVRLLRPEPSDSLSALPPVRVRRVADYVHARLDREITVADLAELADLSPAHFSRLFAEATGQPPGRYVQGVRLDAAARLLRETRAGVGEVALRVGYADPSAFGAAFRRRFGASPTAYRKSYDR